MTSRLFTVLARGAAFAVVLASASAVAETVKTSPGKPVVVAAPVVTAEGSCSVGAINLKVTAPPQHGTYQVTTIQHTMTQGFCKGKSMKFPVIFYKPAAGFRGADRIVYGFEYDTYTNSHGSTWVAETVDIVVE